MISGVVPKFDNSGIFPGLALAALRPQGPLVLWNFPLGKTDQSQFRVWFRGEMSINVGSFIDVV